MRWIFQLALVSLLFLIRPIAIRQYKRAIELKRWDYGMYRFTPIEGEKAVKMAKIAIKIINISVWGTPIMLIIHNIWDFIIFPYLYPGK